MPLDVETGRLLRDMSPQVLGAVIRRMRDFASAEDAVQEALLAAAAQWPRDGVPENPRAWLIQVATRRAADQARADIARRRRESAAVMQAGYAMPAAELHDEFGRDDTLVLLLMCCHPALTPASAIALTLRAVGGLTTAEIAGAFLVPETTMAQRISRAKQTIQSSGVPFRMPEREELAARLSSLLHVLYLIFNEGYTCNAGPHLERGDLTAEAIRLTRIVHRLLPEHTETAGLLALMLLTDARRAARTGPAGELIPLDRQDRSRWNRNQIAEGIALLSAALPKGAAGPYQLQAAIAALHDEAGRAEETDWAQILVLYDLLARMSDNPMISLNRAVAAAMVHGPAAGLEILDGIEASGNLKGHHRVDAVRARFLEMAGDPEQAIRHYRIAAGQAANLAERNYLLIQANRLSR